MFAEHRYMRDVMTSAEDVAEFMQDEGLTRIPAVVIRPVLVTVWYEWTWSMSEYDPYYDECYAVPTLVDETYESL